MTNPTQAELDRAVLDSLRRLILGEAQLVPPVREPDRSLVPKGPEATRDRLVEWVQAHRDGTAADAARALGLTKSEVHHHLLHCVSKGRLIKSDRLVEGRRQTTMRTPEQDAPAKP